MASRGGVWLAGVFSASCVLALAACGGGGGGSGDGGDGGRGAYAVSGTIKVLSATAIDGDVNDPAAPRMPNNTFAQAQRLVPPVTVGGYVSQPRAGAPGASYADGDVFDVYRVDLKHGMRLSLHIASEDIGADDLDLFLFSVDNTDDPLDWSAGATTQVESLTVPADGSYYVAVWAYSGAANYVLNASMPGSADFDAGGLRLSDPFVPGQVVVKFKDGVGARAATREAEMAALGMKPLAGAAGRAQLFTLEGEALVPRRLPRLGGKQTAVDQSLQAKLRTLEVIKELSRRPDVEYAEPNYIRQAYRVPNDEYYALQWHYPLINLPQAWDLSIGASVEPVVVAVIDTGVLMRHPDLRNRLTDDGYDFISDARRARDGDGIDPDPDDPGDSAAGRSSFHGTHVAGTVAADTNNGQGVAGVSWGAKIMPLRVLGEGGGTEYDILQALLYAAGLENDSKRLPRRKADIINLSLGGPGSSQASREVIRRVREAGVIIIAAAGNENTSAPSYPAAYDGVVSVSAVDIEKRLAPYSNYGSTIDVAAPGGDVTKDRNGDGYPDGVLSTVGGDTDGRISYSYTFYQGTSMAAPHVAGVAALMKAVWPAMGPNEFDRALSSGAIVEDLGAPGRDNSYGYGLIDAYKAVVYAKAQVGAETPPAESLLTVTPRTLSFDALTNRLTITVGGEQVSGVKASTNAPWLSVAAEEGAVDGDGLGRYLVSVNRTGLADGIYDGEVTFTSSNDTTLTVPVLLQVVTQVRAGDAGYHYVLLIDADNPSKTVGQVAVAAKDGAYAFRFDSVPAGRYYIVAGTDSDNDGYICDSGEACGAYASLNELTAVTVSGNVAGLEFMTGFEAAFEASSSSAAATRASGPLPIARKGH